MNLATTFSIAARALRRNVMRSVLTTLGIVIGVAAVLTTVGLGTGAKMQVEAQIASLGRNVLPIWSNGNSSSGVRAGWGGSGNFTVEDALAIAREVPNVSAVSPEVRTNAQVAAGNQNWFTQILGEAPEYFDLRQWPLTAGASFGEQDVRSANKVAVIGTTTASQIFGDDDPVGQVIRVRNVPFKIIGLMKSKGFNLFGQDQDDVLIIPYTTAMKRLTGDSKIRSIMAQAANSDVESDVQQGVVSLLRQRHRIVPGHDDDFIVRSQKDITEMATATSSTLTALLAGVASVSLIVGAIGIMNIMLVSVTERTREIGIRIAIGAHGRDIMLQFLVEAVFLSSLGGLAGVALGLGSAALVERSMQMPTSIPILWIIGSVLISALVGICSGLYPAMKAAALDPIDALRYE